MNLPKNLPEKLQDYLKENPISQEELDSFAFESYPIELPYGTYTVKGFLQGYSFMGSFYCTQDLADEEIKYEIYPTDKPEEVEVVGSLIKALAKATILGNERVANF